jgi:hypothetical protein
MAWERRRNGQRYYYRGRRVGGRVVKQYVGRGPAAKKAAEEDVAQRVERQAHRQEDSLRRQQFQAAGCLLSDMHKQGADLLEAALLSAGLYRHHRGAWRRRRVEKKEESEAKS